MVKPSKTAQNQNNYKKSQNKYRTSSHMTTKLKILNYISKQKSVTWENDQMEFIIRI